MLNINITKFRENIFEYIGQTIQYNDVINISTKDGNAIVLSEEDYNSLLETMYLNAVPGMSEKLIEGMNTPTEELIPESEVEW